MQEKTISMATTLGIAEQALFSKNAHTPLTEEDIVNVAQRGLDYCHALLDDPETSIAGREDAQKMEEKYKGLICGDLEITRAWFEENEKLYKENIKNNPDNGSIRDSIIFALAEMPLQR